MWDGVMKVLYATTIAPVVFVWRVLSWILADLGRLLTVAALAAYFIVPFSSAVPQDLRSTALLLRLFLIVPAIWGAVNLYEAVLAGIRGYYANPADHGTVRPGAWWPVTNEAWWAHLSWKLFFAYALAYAILAYNLLDGVLRWPEVLNVNVGYLADLIKFSFEHPPTRLPLEIPLPPVRLVAYGAYVVAGLHALEGMRRLGAFGWLERKPRVARAAPAPQPPAPAETDNEQRPPSGSSDQHAGGAPGEREAGRKPERKRLTTQEVVRELKKELVLPEDTLRGVADLAVLIADPEGFQERWKMEPPKGALLWGPPGTGKTTIVRKVAEITGMHLVTLSPANARSMYVGESAKLIEKAFREARASAPAIVFIDEAETVAGNRAQAGGDGAAQEQIAAVNQLLQEIEGAGRGGSRRYVFVIAATNHPDMVDPAFRSRLGREVPVGMPTHENRVEILRNLLERFKENLGEIDYDELASRTEGFSGRDLRTLVQLAVTRVHGEGREKLEWEDLLDAVDEVYKNR